MKRLRIPRQEGADSEKHTRKALHVVPLRDVNGGENPLETISKKSVLEYKL